MNTAELAVVFEEARRNETSLPVPRRILLYRGLANLCGDVLLSAQFHDLADELESADRRCREFRFELPAQTPLSGEQVAKMAT